MNQKTFEEAMGIPPYNPHLFIKYNKDGSNGQGTYDWGMVRGNDMPTLTLIGAVQRVQSDVFFKAIAECPEPALVIVWDVGSEEFLTFIHPSIPLDPIVGMLAIISNLLVASKLMTTKVGTSGLLGPDGRPMQR